MDDQQNVKSESLKERAWTTDEIRKHSSTWTLAGDVGLFNLLNEFSHHIISRTHEVENSVDTLVHQTKMTTARINNVINDFHMLSNLQFVENRVYDEEVQEPVTENKPVVEKSKEQREAEMLPKIVQAIELGLAVLDTAFDCINVNEISDSEDEEDISSEGRTILEPKDPYENRPLPYIIGSEEFMKCDYAGLKDLIEEDAPSFSEESSVSETDETSSDEGEPLPLDDDRYSEKRIDAVSQDISDKISSSDESELFGSEKEVNGFGSESSLEFKSKEKNIQRTSVDVQPEKETRASSVSSLQSKLKLPQVLPLPVPKLQEKEEDEDHSDDESPFRKKTGLFTSDIKFGDEKEDDLFGGDLFGKSRSDVVKEVKTVEVPKALPKKMPSSAVPETRKLSLFDNDEDSEDDIFNSLIKTKNPSTKTSNAGSQDSSEKADTLSTPSSAPSTKPSGNAFDFVTGAGNADSLFGDEDSDGDDLFSSKKTQGKKADFDSSENDDLFDTISPKVPKESRVLGETKSSLFEDKSILNQPKKKETVKEKRAKSLFEDSDSSDQEKVVAKSPLSVPVNNKREINLFDDDDAEEDIFSKVAKESKLSKPVEQFKSPNLFEDSLVAKESMPSKPVEKSDSPNLFQDSLVAIETKPSKPVQKPKPSNLFDSESAKFKATQLPKTVESKGTGLFDDTEDVVQPSKILPIVQQSTLPSLFDDSDNFDLFAPKSSIKQSDPVKSLNVKVPKPVTEVNKLNDEVDGNVASKISLPAKNVDIDNPVSFDVPVDSSNVLSVINKGRVKVTAKRRKPTRQGRLAALEGSEQDVPAMSTIAKSDLDAPAEDSDSLFSSSATKTVESEPPKLDHKSQEKKKMNLMSQLISEVALSKVALKKTAEKEEEDEDDVNIFSESAKDKSNSFSFKSPEENGIASMFPIEKKDDDNSTSKSNSFEDDFFTEPAFQNFRSSISHKDPVLNLDEDEDDDDDLFSAIKSSALPKAKADSPDLFGDDTDIFADVEKEKYEMFPSQLNDEDDDIFSNVLTISEKSSSKASNTSSIKKIETKEVKSCEDPLTGLLGE